MFSIEKIKYTTYKSHYFREYKVLSLVKSNIEKNIATQILNFPKYNFECLEGRIFNYITRIVLLFCLLLWPIQNLLPLFRRHRECSDQW